jgi:hypothetical protein
MLLLQAGFFFLFFLPILWCSHPGIHPQEELAKFGYRSDRKVKKKIVRIFLYFCDLLEPTIFGFGQNIRTVMTKNEMKLFFKLKKISKFWKDSLNFRNHKIEYIYIYIWNLLSKFINISLKSGNFGSFFLFTKIFWMSCTGFSFLGCQTWWKFTPPKKGFLQHVLVLTWATWWCTKLMLVFSPSSCNWIIR